MEGAFPDTLHDIYPPLETGNEYQISASTREYFNF